MRNANEPRLNKMGVAGHTSNVSMAEHQERCVFKVDNVHFQLPYAIYSNCTIQLYPSQICVVDAGETKLTLPLHCMRSIEIHQPIFSANYISGEFNEQGSITSFTMTFNKGGATDFARTFFRLTEGQLVTNTATSAQTTPMEAKKTQ